MRWSRLAGALCAAVALAALACAPASAAPAGPQVLPDPWRFAGRTVVAPNTAEFLVDPNGELRGITSGAVFDRLFRDRSHRDFSLRVEDFQVGTNLSDSAYLARYSNGAVFLVTNGRKWGIPSSAVMDKYNFNWRTIVDVSNPVLDSIPTGPNWG
jgi:hypothetical protein